MTGSRSFQFDRLVRALDETDFASILDKPVEVFVQIGSSTYRPSNIRWAEFLSRDEFARQTERADIVVTHGGTGAIIGAVTLGKRVVAVPRLVEFHEAVDNHQVELIRQFETMGIIKGCFDLRSLSESVVEAATMEFVPYESNTQTVLDSIEGFLQEVAAKKRRR